MVDMHAPGVEVRPLRQITGEAEFNEVYLTDVRIPDADRIGDVGDGWRVSMTTLMNERTTIGGGSGGGGARSAARAAIEEAVDIWKQLPTIARTGRATRPADADCGSRTRCCGSRTCAPPRQRKAGNPGPEGSIAKLAIAELNKATLRVLHRPARRRRAWSATTTRSVARTTLSTRRLGTACASTFLRARANSIEGGTSEIMRNILGEQILGLPGEPRVDKDCPGQRCRAADPRTSSLAVLCHPSGC